MHEMLYRTRPLEPNEMMEPAIEDIFKFKDRAYVCIERNGGDCKGCAFDGDVESCASFNCQYEGRSDCTDVYFKKVEEVF